MQLTHSYSSIKLFDNCPLRYYRQRIKKDVVDEGGDASKYGDRIHKLIEDRLKDAKLDVEIEQYEPLCKAIERTALNGELHVEKELVLTQNLIPTGWWDSDAWLRSKLDVLVLVGDMAIVVDWKTGKRNVDKLQMQLFAAQVFKHFEHVKTVKTSLVWLKDMSMDVDMYERENVNTLWSEIMSKIQRIYDAYNAAIWPARPSGLCRYCPCRHDCDYAKL